MRQATAILYGLVGLLALAMLGWTLLILVTGFAAGGFPCTDWKTEHRFVFGTAWLVVAACVLLPWYLLVLSNCIFALAGLNHRGNEGQFHWLEAVVYVFLLAVLTFGARVAVTAWFPEPMHPPFDWVQGGAVPGIVASVTAFLLAATTLRLMQRVHPFRARVRGGK